MIENGVILQDKHDRSDAEAKARNIIVNQRISLEGSQSVEQEFIDIDDK